MSSQDVTSLTNFFQNTCGLTPEEKQLSVSGKNWGEVDLNGQSTPLLLVVFFLISQLVEFIKTFLA